MNEVLNTTPGYRTRWIGLVFIGISLLVISLDNTVLNIALPSLAADLQASTNELLWVVDAYVLVFASLLLTMGALSDRVGRKRALQVGVILFAFGSLVAANAASVEILIGARAFLGFAAALIMPSTLSIITATFPPKERLQAIAIWAAIFGLGVAIGPVFGGWLLETFSWHAVFLINLPIAVVALIGGALYLAESKDDSAPKLDLPGVVLSISGLFALVFAMIEAGVYGWTHPGVLLAFAAAFVLLGLFAWWENRTPNAMLPLYFFRNMSFTGASLAITLVSFSLSGSIFFLSQYFQTVLGLGALSAGVGVLPLALALFVATGMSARIAIRLGTKYTVALGIGTAGASLLLMSLLLKENTPVLVAVLAQMLLGVGMGTAMSPATDSIMGSLPVNKAGIGSAMNDTTRELGNALGVAVLGTLMYSIYRGDVASLRSVIPSASYEAVISGIQAAHLTAATAAPEVAQTVLDTANRAFVNGMNTAMLIGAIVMGLAALFVLWTLPNHPQRENEHETEERMMLQQ